MNERIGTRRETEGWYVVRESPPDYYGEDMSERLAGPFFTWTAEAQLALEAEERGERLRPLSEFFGALAESMADAGIDRLDGDGARAIEIVQPARPETDAEDRWHSIGLRQGRIGGRREYADMHRRVMAQRGELRSLNYHYSKEGEHSGKLLRELRETQIDRDSLRVQLEAVKGALEALEQAARELLAALPKCTFCERVATRAWVRGAERYCDEHGRIATGPDVPEYPRAVPMRKLAALVGNGGGT